MLKNDGQWNYQKYYNTPQPLVLTEPAAQYFRILDSLVEDEDRAIPKSIVPERMVEAFRNFTKREKVRYITENIKYLASVTKNKGSRNESPYLLVKEGKTVEANCQAKSFLCFYRNVTTIRLETEPRTLMVIEADSIKMADLQNYLVHEGKNMFRNKIYLEPIVDRGKSWADVRRYEFTLSEKEFSRIYDDLFNCVMDIRNEQLVSLFSPVPGALKSQILKSNTAITQKIINKKQYEKFSEHKRYVLQEKGISYLTFEQKIYEEENKDTKIVIKRRNAEKNLFKAKIYTNEDIYDLKERFLDSIEEVRNSLLIESQLLETYPESPSNCVALYQKYFINKSPQSSIYMREILSVTGLLMSNSIKSIMSIEDKKRFDEFIFMKSIDSPLVKSFFEYIAIFVKDTTKKSDYRAEIVIIGDFNLTQSFTSEMAIEFLCQYYHAAFGIEKAVQIDLIKKESFKTANMVVQKKMTEAINVEEGISQLKTNDKHSDQNTKEVIVEFAEPESGTRFSRFKFISDDKEDTEKTDKNGIPFFKHRFGVSPVQGYNIQQNCVHQNFMKGEWKKGDDGGLVCTNQKLLTQHKKIFKHILASIGSNILKGGNILNVSLPVTIFKKEGHLQMLADSFSLSPKLLENVTDPLERIKRAVLVSVAVGTLGISVEKPFFPTLGQTLQVWIGGCPMYLEQILRYPPTGAYLFYGRGYRIHGQVEPKISFGINGVKGYSERPSYIQFDDGQKIELSYGKLVIGGIFMGERQFNFYDKTFAYDKKNNMFAELIFGAKDTQIFGKNKQTKDFLYGKIYQLTSQFATKFSETQPPKPYPSKKYIKSVLSQFEGYWNGAVKFDDTQYIDFEKDLPSKVELEEHALPSDTRFRKDLVNLLAGNIDQAQRQKEILEEGQRRDRKLRAQKSGKKK